MLLPEAEWLRRAAGPHTADQTTDRTTDRTDRPGPPA